MLLVNALQQLVGWRDDSATSDHWEKLGLLLAAVGLTASTAGKEFLDRASAADVEKFILNVTIFRQQCICVDNGCEKLVCPNSFPTSHPAASDTATNVLTGVAVFFEIAILFLLIRSGIRACTTARREPVNEVLQPSEIPQNEGSYLNS